MADSKIRACFNAYEVASNLHNIVIFVFSDPWPTTPQKVIVPGSVTSATVQNLQPATSYHLRIIAENRLGQSEASQLVQVTTTEEGTYYR